MEWMQLDAEKQHWIAPMPQMVGLRLGPASRGPEEVMPAALVVQRPHLTASCRFAQALQWLCKPARTDLCL